MGKELDKFKIRRLLESFKAAMLWFWYLSGIIMAGGLWFVQIPEGRAQAIAFALAFAMYSALSACISKVDSLITETE